MRTSGLWSLTGRLRPARVATTVMVLGLTGAAMVGCTSLSGGHHAGGSAPPSASAPSASSSARSPGSGTLSGAAQTPGVAAPCAGTPIKPYQVTVPGGAQVSLVVYWDRSDRQLCASAEAPNDAYIVFVEVQQCKVMDVAGRVCMPASLSASDYKTQQRSGSAGPVSLTIAPARTFGVAAAFTGPDGKGSWVLGIRPDIGHLSLANGGPTLLSGLGAYRP